MRNFAFFCFFLCLCVLSSAQDQPNRGSIPEELLRPKRGEEARFPVDTVIGELGQGEAPLAAYSLAKTIAAGLISANKEHPGLAGISAALKDEYFSVLEEVYPRSYRLGGGREEADGAVSFMVRLIGKDLGVTGELFVRYVTRQIVVENKEAENKETENKETENKEAVNMETVNMETENNEAPVEHIVKEEIEEEIKVIEYKTVGSWRFDDLILEEAKSHEEEERDSLQRFDFSPYERFF
jgi:hypothetical protein